MHQLGLFPACLGSNDLAIANREVRDGDIKRFLDATESICWAVPAAARGSPTSSPTTRWRSFPFALSLLFLCVQLLPRALPDASTSLNAFVLASLILGFLLGFFLEASLGLLISFWFSGSDIIDCSFTCCSAFYLSGHMFPLDMLPSEAIDLNLFQINIRGMVDLVPLQLSSLTSRPRFGWAKVEGAEIYKAMEAGG